MSPSHASSPPSADHVWANACVFLPSGRASAACQLGGDRLGPRLAELADRTVVVGPAVRGVAGWTAVRAPLDRGPFAPGTVPRAATGARHGRG